MICFVFLNSLKLRTLINQKWLSITIGHINDFFLSLLGSSNHFKLLFLPLECEVSHIINTIATQDNLFLSTGMHWDDNVNWPPQRDSKTDVSSVRPSSIRLDEGLTLETSVLESFYSIANSRPS